MPNLKDLEYYAEICEHLLDNGLEKENRELWDGIDAIYACDLKIPDALSSLSWVGPNAKFADPIGHDSIEAIVRFLGTRNPNIHVRPFDPNPEHHKKIEWVEQVLHWNWVQLNKRGAEPFRAMVVRNMALHGRVAFQTQFMPYEIKRKDSKGKPVYTKEQQRQMKQYGDFNAILHPNQNVYAEWNDGFLKGVLSVRVQSLSDLFNELGKDHPVLKKVAKKDGGDYSPADLRTTYVTRFDYMDTYCRCEYFVVSGGNTVSAAGDKYEIQRVEHGLPFIPWVVVEFGHPILEAVYKTNVWGNLGMATAIQFAKMLQTVDEKDTIMQVPNVNDPNIYDDDSGPAGVKVVGQGTQVYRLSPHQLDPQLMTVIGTLQRQLASSASVSALVGVEQYIGGNTPFSSINAAQSTAAAHLGLVANAIERALAGLFYQELQWLKHSREHTIGVRSISKGDTETTKAGSVYMLKAIQPDTNMKDAPENLLYIDPDQLIVDVELQPMTIQDEMAQANKALIMQQAGLSRKVALENLVADADAEMVQVGVEQLAMAMIEADKQKIIGEAQAYVQGLIAEAQAKVQMMVQQQQMAQQQQMPQQGSPDPQAQVREANVGAQTQVMQGRDVRRGAPDMSQVAPGENRVSANGRDDGGQALA